MSLDQVTITNKGLLNINRKIINDRKFEKSLISTIGEVTFKDSVASEFNKTSYLQKTTLELEDSPTTIVFQGTYMSSPSFSNQTCWTLTGSEGSIVLQFISLEENDELITFPQVVLPSGQAFSFKKIPFLDETSFKLYVAFKNDHCSLTIDLGTEAYGDDYLLSETINMSTFNTISLGNNPTQVGISDQDFFWEGSIEVKNFLITQKSVPVFTPTLGYNLSFSKIVVSDGKFSLPSEHIPNSVLKHLYVYDIDQITRSSNTLLLTSELTKESKLTIREIGLYAKVDNDEFLFGYIQNLNIDKGDSVPYDLILTVNLAISVVNVVGFPTISSFFLKQVKAALLKNFTTVLNTNTYVIENLERIIRMNSLQPIPKKGYCGRTAVVTSQVIDDKTSYDITYEGGEYCCDNPTTIQSIGYNTPQLVYREQKEINKQEDCYSAMQTYAKLHKNFKKTFKTILDTSFVALEGDLSITDDGKTTGFSLENYITGIPTIDLSENWELNTSFSISASDTSAEGILSMGYVEEDETEKVRYTRYLYLYISNNNLKANTLSANIGTTLFSISPNVQYYLKLVGDVSSQQIQASISTDGESFSAPVILSTTGFNDSEVNTIIAGVNGYYDISVSQNLQVTQPFTDGTLYLLDWNYEQGDNSWNMKKSAIFENNKLIQYSHLPSYNMYSYKLYDICNPSYYIDFLGDNFASNGTLLNFSNDSFSVSFKVNLENDSSKVLVRQINYQNTEFFRIELVRIQGISDANYDFVFSILTNNGIQEFKLPQPIAFTDISKYTQAPILFTIIKNGNYINIYENNTLFIEGILSDSIPSSQGSFLTNSAPEKINSNFIDLRDIEVDLNNPSSWTPEDVNTLIEAISDQGATNVTEEDLRAAASAGAFATKFAFYSAYLGSESNRMYVFESATEQEAMFIKGKYLKELILIENSITPVQLYYITNLTDTNF